MPGDCDEDLKWTKRVGGLNWREVLCPRMASMTMMDFMKPIPVMMLQGGKGKVAT